MGLRKKRKQKFHSDRVYLARVTKPHGLHGEVKMQLFGCTPMLLEDLETFFTGEGEKTLQIEKIRGSEKTPIFKFAGVETRDDSEALVGTELWVRPNVLPELEENTYYESDILYTQAQRQDGMVLGRVEQILETGECDVLVIRDPEGNELLLPAILNVIKEVRKEEGIIVVEPLEEEAMD